MSKKERVITILLAVLLLVSLIITACSMNEIRKLKFRLDRADYDLLFSIDLVASDLFATEIPSKSDETLTRYLTNAYSHLAECSILFPISSYADNSSLYDALKLLEEYLERIQESGALIDDELGLDTYGYNFVTKRGICRENARLSWTQVETGSAITWKYPSCILAGDNSVGEFYSVAMTNHFQQADTGTKMIHVGRNTRSRIVSKGISAGRSENSYRGLVRVAKAAENARNYSQCDSLLIGDKCGAHTFPVIESGNPTAVVEHEATTSKISEEQLFYCNQRGLTTEDAVGLIVNGYAREVLNKLPMEFAVEAQKLLAISLEGSVG